MLYRKVAALAAGASASMLVLGSGIARADESAYIQILDVGGVPYDTPAGAVLMGQGVCTSCSLVNPNRAGRSNDGIVGGFGLGELVGAGPGDECVNNHSSTRARRHHRVEFLKGAEDVVHEAQPRCHDRARQRLENLNR